MANIFKNFRVSTKLSIGFGFMILFVLLTGGIAFFACNAFKGKTETLTGNLEMAKFMLAKEVDHFKWSANVANLFLKNEEELHVQTDPTKCDFGKWYYSFIKTDEFKKLPVNVQNRLLAIEEPHKHLHESVIAIKNDWRRDNHAIYDHCATLYQQGTIPKLQEVVSGFRAVFDAIDKNRETVVKTAQAVQEKENDGKQHESKKDSASKDKLADLRVILLEREIDHLNWSADISSLFLANKERLEVQTDPHKCGFGQWYDEYVKSPDFKELPEDVQTAMLKLDVPHRQLHESAIAIERGWEPRNDHIFDKCLALYENTTNKILEKVGGLFNELFVELDAYNAQLDKEMHAVADGMVRSVIIIVIVSLIIGIFVALVITGSINNPLKLVVHALNRIADGDFTSTIDLDQKDEMGDLAKTCNDVIRRWKQIVFDLQGASNQMASSAVEMSSTSEQISRGSESLARTSEESAAAIEQMSESIQGVLKDIDSQTTSVTETSAAVEQMTANIQTVFKNIEQQASAINESTTSVEELLASIKQIAGSSEKVSSIAATVNERAKESNNAVKETVIGMRDIADSANQINNIIAVITGIASQTNLLALNAAIEAARAGDAGKGFAVVADEVRNLAEQSSQAASEITELIRTANAKAERGLQLVEGVEAVITQMVDAIQEVSSLAQEVNSSTGEQEKGTEEIAKAMESLNSITQEVVNAMEEQAKGADEITKTMQQMSVIAHDISSAMSEQAAVSSQVSNAVQQVSTVATENETGAKQSLQVSHDLSDQAQKLDTIVSHFKI